MSPPAPCPCYSVPFPAPYAAALALPPQIQENAAGDARRLPIESVGGLVQGDCNDRERVLTMTMLSTTTGDSCAVPACTTPGDGAVEPPCAAHETRVASAADKGSAPWAGLCYTAWPTTCNPPPLQIYGTTGHNGPQTPHHVVECCVCRIKGCPDCNVHVRSRTLCTGFIMRPPAHECPGERWGATPEKGLGVGGGDG